MLEQGFQIGQKKKSRQQEKKLFVNEQKKISGGPLKYLSPEWRGKQTDQNVLLLTKTTSDLENISKLPGFNCQDTNCNKLAKLCGRYVM